jgi:hypothetical protein
LCLSAAPPDSSAVDSVALGVAEVVSTVRRTARRVGSGDALRFDAAEVGRRLRSLGEADATLYLKTLPGVGSVGEYGGGLSLQGNDLSATDYRLEGATVFQPFHFGGIFSTFHPDHYPRVTLEKSIHTAAQTDRVGGSIALQTAPQRTTHIGGVVNAGMMASTLLLQSPLGRQGDLRLSGRLSYINTLYRGMMNSRNEHIDYDFSDVNATVRPLVTATDRVTLNVFHSHDRLDYYDRRYTLETVLRWHNTTASAAWEHRGARATQVHRLAYSTFDNHFVNEMQQVALAVPTDIAQWAAGGDWQVRLGQRTSLLAGYEYRTVTAHPQQATLVGYGTGETAAAPRVDSRLLRAYLQADVRLGDAWSVGAGAKGMGYRCGTYRPATLDPVVTLHYARDALRAALHWGAYTQSLHQVGFSDIGMSSDFWLPAERRVPLLHSYNYAANITYAFPWGEVAADLYYRTLRHTAEYDGKVLDLLDSDYDVSDHLLTGRGYNYGVDLWAAYRRRALLTSLAYSWGRARRRYPTTPYEVTAATEPGHRLCATAAYTLSARWELAATFTYAGGRPYTPIRSVYLVANNLMMDYGQRNSARLPAYQRLDLSATYHLPSRRRRDHFLHFAFINAYAHNNVEMLSYNVDRKTGNVVCRKIVSLYRALPSLSYSLRF